MSVNVQYLHLLEMDIVMIKPTLLNAIMMGEIVVALVLMISIVLNAHATSQSQVSQWFILFLFCYFHTKRLFKTWTSIMKASHLCMYQIWCFGWLLFISHFVFRRQWTDIVFSKGKEVAAFSFLDVQFFQVVLLV